MQTMLKHIDRLESLNGTLSLCGKLHHLRSALLDHFPFIDHIGVSIYDSETQLFEPLAYSSANKTELTHFKIKIDHAHSLQTILKEKQPCVINDLDVISDDTHNYTTLLAQQGFRSSYTHPMIFEDRFYGFIFFNSQHKDVFSERVLSELDMCSHLIMLLVVNERMNVQTLAATVRSALKLTHERDPETGAHISRMSRFARLIAVELAGEFDFDDEFIDHIFLFSPLHDIGKISIPDHILLKPGKLSDDEYEIMKTHATKGREMIDDLMDNYNLERFQYIDMLRHIAEFHHEAFDGSGYPRGLAEEAIPIEARIVAVADVFDALSSKRPYKEAWTNDKAFDILKRLAGTKLDSRCVEALMNNREEVEQIQQQFREDEYG